MSDGTEQMASPTLWDEDLCLELWVSFSPPRISAPEELGLIGSGWQIELGFLINFCYAFR